MNRTVARAVVLLPLVLGLVSCGGGGSDGPAAGSASTTRPAGAGSTDAGAGPIDLQVVPLPDSVSGARFASFSSDGERILFSGVPEGSSRVEVLSVREGGSDLRCLTCGIARSDDDPLLKPFAFADGARVLVRVGEQSPVRAARHAVVECAPSTADCKAARLIPIVAPSAGDASVVQDQREMRISPDDRMIGFSQVRRSSGGDDVLIAVVAELRRAGERYELVDGRVVSTLGELKNFTPDGTAVLVSAFTTLPDRVANPDVVRVDLTSDDQSRVTFADDYDEDIDLSPDGAAYVVASGRTTGLFETVSQVRRPNFIDPGLEPLTAYLFVNHRRELLEPWLVEVGAEEHGGLGRQVNPGSIADGYDARVPMSWSPTGDRILFWEGRSDPNGPPTGSTRIVVAHLAGERVAGARPAATPSPTWAPALAGFVPPAPSAPTSRDGRNQGSVTIARRTEGDQQVVEVEYHDFSDDGTWIIDGTESATFDGGSLGRTTYVADLRLTGSHEGHLRADAVISAGGMEGSITSSVDGRRLHLP
jgi:hypothetical protein